MSHIMYVSCEVSLDQRPMTWRASRGMQQSSAWLSPPRRGRCKRGKSGRCRRPTPFETRRTACGPSTAGPPWTFECAAPSSAAWTAPIPRAPPQSPISEQSEETEDEYQGVASRPNTATLPGASRVACYSKCESSSFSMSIVKVSSPRGSHAACLLVLAPQCCRASRCARRREALRCGEGRCACSKYSYAVRKV